MHTSNRTGTIDYQNHCRILRRKNLGISIYATLREPSGYRSTGKGFGRRRIPALTQNDPNADPRAAVVHQLPEQCAEQEQREELSKEMRGTPMKVWVQWASGGSPANSAAMSAAAR